MLKTTIRLGFWKSVTDLQNILPNLIKICSCNRDFENYRDKDDLGLDKMTLYKRAKANLTRMNLENLIVMKCKMLSCEIMDIILDMETNVRVSKATQILKKMINAGDKQVEENKQLADRILAKSEAIKAKQEPESKKTTNTLHALQEK